MSVLKVSRSVQCLMCLRRGFEREGITEKALSPQISAVLK